jgi:hypothetical protein
MSFGVAAALKGCVQPVELSDVLRAIEDERAQALISPLEAARASAVWLMEPVPLNRGVGYLDLYVEGPATFLAAARTYVQVRPWSSWPLARITKEVSGAVDIPDRQWPIATCDSGMALALGEGSFDLTDKVEEIQIVDPVTDRGWPRGQRSLDEVIRDDLESDSIPTVRRLHTSTIPQQLNRAPLARRDVTRAG